MCNCNGKHTSYPGIRHEDHIRYQGLSKQTKQVLETPNKAKRTVPKPNLFAPCPVRDAKPSGSGVKLEIIEVEKGCEETKSDSVGSKELVITNPADHPVPCVVADMRSSKTSSIPLDKNEKIQKTNENDIIKDTTSNAEAVSSSQLDPPVGNQILPVDQVKEVKTDKNITIQENRLVNGFVDLAHEPVSPLTEKRPNLPCGCQGHFAGFQFKKEWNALAEPDLLKRKANLLKSICPKHLVQAFGNYWDERMLVDVVKCLLHHFNQTEQQKVFEYVKALPQLERFNIIAGFLDKDEKLLIQELVKNCSVHADSNIISAFPSCCLAAASFPEELTSL
uniref:RNA-polymerase II-associated protein 3-like C-terminal domain-containing protein n=1 Tax=Lygus hesperus TaxID=30085 RepID=A0A0K8TC37_LYGHE